MALFDAFEKRKEQCLSRADLSRKGSVDADIESLVRFINECDAFFTTSSCSGRVTLIDGRFDEFEVKKQNCPWLLVAHQKCQKDDVHSVALNSGFRNSGITIGKKGRTMMAVRSTHGLEVPLSRKGKLLVNEEYIQYLVQIANQKMDENKKRTDRFYSCLQSALRCEGIFEKSVLESQTRPVYTRRRRRKAMKEDVLCTSPDERAPDREEEVEFDPVVFTELHL
ncbi:tRNA wybutosine-synthesizing protein 3 homolog isoform X2 [Microcaecilia unicolor]|uniref:tRNA wybutosine-synthesizing protein 3 homolog n=1 Tax=Microcaecilia unicolor TaxID=1415580 RepID=A0A6P7YDY7_9AMPH|nr:tRNA wybutosine-synthesizing protein 3 homolog isoform X2 [Microcaecilia unicolor]